jgi:hypothetical protein
MESRVPEAAWCSACQKYVWVSPEGWCQFGHEPAFLSGAYTTVAAGGMSPVAHVPAPVVPLALESMTPSGSDPQHLPAKRRPWVLLALLGVFTLIMVGGIALATWFAFDAVDKTEAAANQEFMEQSQQSYANTHIQSGSMDEEPPSTPNETAPLPISRMTRAEWNAFVSEQYPGYRIKQRIEVPNQWQRGLDGVNYVLVNKRQPKFTLLVSLAQLGPDQTMDDAPEAYMDVSGQIATTDALFSVDAARLTQYLRDKGQDAIIDGYVADKPSASAVAFSGFGDEGAVNVLVATGPNAVARAIKSPENSDYFVEGGIPSGPRNENVWITVSPW